MYAFAMVVPETPEGRELGSKLSERLLQYQQGAIPGEGQGLTSGSWPFQGEESR